MRGDVGKDNPFEDTEGLALRCGQCGTLRVLTGSPDMVRVLGM